MIILKKIFYNGDFITLEKDNVEAIMIEDGVIKKVGSKRDVFVGDLEETEIVDLQGKTMMPAFLDAHSHFTGVANNLLQVDLGECINFEEIIDRLVSFKKDNHILDGVWIIACNYDHNNLKEKTHPRKEVLDKACPNNPVLLQHKSGHMGVLNSKALDILNIDFNTSDIEGGTIEKVNGEVTGYLEENAFINYQMKVPMPSLEVLLDAYEKAQEIYLKNGITTIQEGMTYPEMVPLYKALFNRNILKLDLVSYIDINSRELFFSNLHKHIKKYNKNFKIGGYKIFLDGSPQGRTAWMREPYVGSHDYFGVSTMSDDALQKAIQIAYDDDLQILAHCNGDRACEQYIKAISKNKKSNDIRPVMIHAQLLGLDQIKYLKPLNIIPSFFIAHTYYWGDTHIENFGYQRAKNISPVASVLKEGIRYTFHQDSPVISPNMFETIWCAVSRKTKSGKQLNEEEKISVLDAIKGVTINASYQYFEEEKKGSIKEGKYANLIIVDYNPLKVAIDDIKNIRVLETIKEGVTLFKADI